jgi:hypothetical protein
MHNRRSFLKTTGKALGGLFFCGCGLAHSADLKDGTPKRITVERVMATKGLSNADRTGTLGDNAARLLNL